MIVLMMGMMTKLFKLDGLFEVSLVGTAIQGIGLPSFLLTRILAIVGFSYDFDTWRNDCHASQSVFAR